MPPSPEKSSSPKCHSYSEANPPVTFYVRLALDVIRIECLGEGGYIRWPDDTLFRAGRRASAYRGWADLTRGPVRTDPVGSPSEPQSLRSFSFQSNARGGGKPRHHECLLVGVVAFPTQGWGEDSLATLPWQTARDKMFSFSRNLENIVCYCL